MAIDIGTDDVRKKMGEILDCVYLRGDEFIISRKNKPLAVLIPLQKFKLLTLAAKHYLLDFLKNQEQQMEDPLTDTELNVLIEESKENVRKQN